MTDIIKAFRRVHADELRQLHYTMFEYNNLPPSVDPEYIERYLQDSDADGFIAWWKLNASEASPGFPEGSLIVSRCTLGTDLNPYGEGAEVIAVTANGHERRFKNRYEDEVVVGFNNITKTPCFDIDIDSATLAEVDLSILYLIHYTRLYPKYGQTINSSSKLAQETVDEVNGAVSASLIIPLSMLAARRAMIDEVNTKFGTNIEVNLSGAWRAEVTRYEDISGEEDIDGSEDGEAVEENTEESEVNENEKEEDTDRDTEKSDDN